MHSEPDQAWLDTSPSEARNASLTVKAYVDGGPLPAWVDEVLDGDGPLDPPADAGSVLARFARDVAAVMPDDADRRRVLRAGLLAAAGRLGDRER